jgi:hypothetical protein
LFALTVSVRAEGNQPSTRLEETDGVRDVFDVHGVDEGRVHNYAVKLAEVSITLKEVGAYYLDADRLAIRAVVSGFPSGAQLVCKRSVYFDSGDPA